MSSQLDEARRGKATAQEEHDLVVKCLAKLRMQNKLMKQRMDKLKEHVPEVEKFMNDHKADFGSRPGTALSRPATALSRPGTALDQSPPDHQMTQRPATAQGIVSVDMDDHHIGDIRQAVNDLEEDLPDLTESDLQDLM